MRIPPLLLALLLPACAPGAPVATDDGPDDGEVVAAKVRESADRLFTAMNRGEADEVLSFYWEDPSFLYVGCTEYISGGGTFRRMVRPFYARSEPDSFDLGIVAMQVLGPDAAVASIRGGSSSSPDLFLTQVWRRHGQEWKISLEHGSWPDCPEPRDPHPFTTASESASLRTGGSGR